MRKLLTILFVLAVFLSKGQDVLSIEEAFGIAMEQNFDIQISGYDKSIADNNFQLGNAGFLPQVVLTGSRSYSNQNVNQVFISGNTNERKGARSNNWNAAASVDWTLFDGLRMFRAYDRLAEVSQIGAINERIAVETTIQNIILTYYEIIINKNSLAVLDSSLRLSQERVDISKSQYEVGKASKSEYLSAQVDYNTDYSTLIKQQELFQRSKHNLNNILGREITTEFEVPLTIPLDSSLRIETLREAALSANRQLLRARRQVNITRLQTEEVRGERLPEIAANFTYSWNKSSSEAGFLLSNQTNGMNYGFTARMNVFNGGDINRRVQNSALQEQISETQLEQLELAVIRDLENTFLEYSNNLTLVRLEQQNLEVALENSRIALDRYRFGTSTYIELRDAQLNAVRAYGRLLSAIYNTKLAETELLRLSGRLVAD